MPPDAPSERPGLSLVVPAFQEEASLPRVLQEAHEALEGLSYEILVCDDGSMDGTAQAAERAGARVLRHVTNQGVGQALKTLYREARGDRVAFFPADGQVPPREVLNLLQHPASVVMGVRKPRRDPLPRLVASHGFNLLVRLLFGLRVRDVDSVVLYDRQVLQDDFLARDLCLPVEILLKAHRRGFPYGEVVVEHLPRRTGRAWGANPRVIVRTLGDLLGAWWDPGRWRLETTPERMRK